VRARFTRFVGPLGETFFLKKRQGRQGILFQREHLFIIKKLIIHKMLLYCILSALIYNSVLLCLCFNTDLVIPIPEL